jgi:hypothetical protein
MAIWCGVCNKHLEEISKLGLGYDIHDIIERLQKIESYRRLACHKVEDVVGCKCGKIFAVVSGYDSSNNPRTINIQLDNGYTDPNSVLSELNEWKRILGVK